MNKIDLPISFSGYSLETAKFILNCVSSKLVQKTPYEICTRKPPSLSFLKIWGCEAADLFKINAQIRYAFLWGIRKKQKDTTFTIVEEKVFVA